MPAGSPSVKAKGCTIMLLQHDPGEAEFCFRNRGESGPSASIAACTRSSPRGGSPRGSVWPAHRTSAGLFRRAFLFCRAYRSWFLFCAAERKHLDALSGLFRRRQVADVGLVEDTSQLLAAGRRNTLIIGSRTATSRRARANGMPLAQSVEAHPQSLGIFLAGLKSGIRRAARHDQKNRAYRIFVADVVLLLRFVQLQLGFDVGIGHLEGSTCSVREPKPSKHSRPLVGV